MDFRAGRLQSTTKFGSESESVELFLCGLGLLFHLHCLLFLSRTLLRLLFVSRTFLRLLFFTCLLLLLFLTIFFRLFLFASFLRFLFLASFLRLFVFFYALIFAFRLLFRLGGLNFTFGLCFSLGGFSGLLLACQADEKMSILFRHVLQADFINKESQGNIGFQTSEKEIE